MTFRKLVLVAGTVWLLGVVMVRGADAYVFRFDTGSTTTPCGSFYWYDELIFHNTGSTDATVRLVDVSNGQAVNPQPLVLPAGKTRSNLSPQPEFPTWAPDSQPLVWLAKLDVPDGVILSSRALVVHLTPCPCGRFQSCAMTYAGLDLPVARALIPPATPSYFLGADVGGLALETSPDSRSNVLIFNGGTLPATAVVEKRSAALETVVSSQTFQIPPDTVIQTTLPAVIPSTGGQAASFEGYVVVTVDQPSLSVVVNLANDRPPFFPASVSR